MKQASPKKPVDLKPLADQLQAVGEKPLLKYFLDGSRHVFKVDDIAYNKQVFPLWQDKSVLAVANAKKAYVKGALLS